MSKIIVDIDNGFDNESVVSCTTKFIKESGINFQEEMIQVIELEVCAHLNTELYR